MIPAEAWSDWPGWGSNLKKRLWISGSPEKFGKIRIFKWSQPNKGSKYNYSKYVCGRPVLAKVRAGLLLYLGF
jgi:hypothetical protein